MIKPKGNRIIVEEVKTPEKCCMIVLPNKHEKLKKYRVLSVGPGKRNINGEYVPIDIKEGDIVLSNSIGLELDTITKGLFCIYEEDVVGVIDG